MNFPASATTKICIRCGRSRRAGEVECPGQLAGGSRCGCELYGDRVRGDAEPAEPEPAPLLGLLGELLNLHPGDVAALYGPKGQGKSTLALTAFEAAAYITCEMPVAAVLRYARRIGAKLGEVVQYKRAPEREIQGEILPVIPLSDEPGAVPDVIFDSINASGEPDVCFNALQAFCQRTGARALALFQVTKENQARGGEDLLHMADAVVRVGNGRIVVEKTRAGGTGSLPFRLTASGPKRVLRSGFFSVEGPPYALKGYPDATAQYDSLLRRAERDQQLAAELRELLTASDGVAVSGRASKLYSGGVVEPDDWRDRARAALADGAVYWQSEQHRIIYLTDDPSLRMD